MTSDVTIGLELVATDAVKKWRATIGPTNSITAKQQAPESIRACFGTDGGKNAVHGSASVGEYKTESSFWFGDGMSAADRPMQTTAVLNNCSLCIIKPHMLSNGTAGQVIDAIL